MCLCIALKNGSEHAIVLKNSTKNVSEHPTQRMRRSNGKTDSFLTVYREDEKVVSVDRRKAHDKALERIEDDLKLASQKMDAIKLKANIMTGVAFFFLYRMVAAAWTGVVVARLPFLPVKMIQGISFRGLKGDDHTQCSFGFIYTLCTIGIKANVPKLFGFTAPKSAFDAQRLAARQQRKEAASS